MPQGYARETSKRVKLITYVEGFVRLEYQHSRGWLSFGAGAKTHAYINHMTLALRIEYKYIIM